MQEHRTNFAERVRLGETTRVEAFSDGVFAIAITLLILEIRPPLDPNILLWDFLVKQGPLYASFLAGFSTIGIMWINHHRLFTLIRKSDDWLLIFNALLLLGITAINYPTALLGEYLGTPNAPVAMAVYAATTVVIAISYNLLWRYASAHNRLLDPHTDPAAVAAVNRSFLFGPLLYAVAFVFAFISVPVSLVIVIGLALFFALPLQDVLTTRPN